MCWKLDALLSTSVFPNEVRHHAMAAVEVGDPERAAAPSVTFGSVHHCGVLQKAGLMLRVSQECLKTDPRFSLGSPLGGLCSVALTTLLCHYPHPAAFQSPNNCWSLSSPDVTNHSRLRILVVFFLYCQFNEMLLVREGQDIFNRLCLTRLRPWFIPPIVKTPSFFFL